MDSHDAAAVVVKVWQTLDGCPLKGALKEVKNAIFSPSSKLSGKLKKEIYQ